MPSNSKKTIKKFIWAFYQTLGMHLYFIPILENLRYSRLPQCCAYHQKPQPHKKNQFNHYLSTKKSQNLSMALYMLPRLTFEHKRRIEGNIMYLDAKEDA